MGNSLSDSKDLHIPFFGNFTQTRDSGRQLPITRCGILHFEKTGRWPTHRGRQGLYKWLARDQSSFSLFSARLKSIISMKRTETKTGMKISTSECPCGRRYQRSGGIPAIAAKIAQKTTIAVCEAVEP